jgi:hypothetical protein
MTAFSFPASPTVGQTYTAGGVTYTWDGTSWGGTSSPLNMATSAQWLADAANLTLVTDKVWSAADPVTLTDSATITPDFSTFINGELLLTSAVGGTRALANPVNIKTQGGWIRLKQPSSGGPCAMTFGSYWKPTNGIVPSLSTGANVEDLLTYQVISGSEIFYTIAKAFGP